MHFVSELFGDVVVIHTHQELGDSTGQEITDQLAERNSEKVVIDLDSTETVTGAGLEMLIRLQERLRAAGGDLRLSSSPGSVRKILEITQVDQQLEVYDCIVNAVRSYN